MVKPQEDFPAPTALHALERALWQWSRSHVWSKPRMAVRSAAMLARQGKIGFVSNSFEIGPVQVGAGQLFLIAGPCVIESEAHVRTMADAIQRIAADLGIPFIFKASYDKANRTSVKSFRGPGLMEGTRILGRLAKDTGLPVLTDVHEPGHCEMAAEAVDVLQIPAFLCRQTDLLVAAGKTGRAVNIKKGQFVAPWDMAHPVEKVRSTGNERVFLTERGASFGYNTLVVDYRSLPVMRQMAPVVFDGTHSVQQPSAANGVSGGQPEFIPLLARAAVAAGIDGLFLEVHDDPANAKSDGANALDLKLLKPLLEKLLAIHQAAGEGATRCICDELRPSLTGDYQTVVATRTGGPALPSITSDLSTISIFLFSQPAGTCLTIWSRYCGLDTKALAASVP